MHKAKANERRLFFLSYKDRCIHLVRPFPLATDYCSNVLYMYMTFPADSSSRDCHSGIFHTKASSHHYASFRQQASAGLIVCAATDATARSIVFSERQQGMIADTSANGIIDNYPDRLQSEEITQTNRQP
jgi:hypothetical protein